MRRARLHIPGLAVAAVALAACSSEDKPGIEVTVDLGGFSVRSLKIAISADMGGFQQIQPGNVDNIPVSTEDMDGDGNIDFVSVFGNPTGAISFRVQTDNKVDLQVAGHAIAFDDTKLIAGADTAWTPLTAGGRASIALTLEAKPPGVVGPDTRSTDVKTASPDITVTPGMAAGFSSVAVCNVDGDERSDLVIGAPLAGNLGQNAVGAVYVLLGKNGFPSAIDLPTASTWMGSSLFGEIAGDQLGTAVACADLDNDTVDDLIIGAPGANAGGGEVYVVFGGGPIATGTIAPDVRFQSDLETGFGGQLLARDLAGDRKAEILVGPRTTGKVHLFSSVVASAAAINVDGADHVTFANYHVSSIAAGNLQRSPIGGLDIVIGDSEARMPGMTDKRGAIFAFPAVDPAARKQYDANSPDPTMTAIYGNGDSQFGAATLAIDTTGEGDDLIIGAPGDNASAGAFYVFKGDSETFFYLRVRPLAEAVAQKDGPAMNGRFGQALGGSASGTTSLRWALVVGAPGTARSPERPLAGGAYLFGGGVGWPFPLYEELFGGATGDALGSMVTGGQLDGDAVGDLITVAPGAGPNHDGAVYVRYNHFVR